MTECRSSLASRIRHSVEATEAKKLKTAHASTSLQSYIIFAYNYHALCKYGNSRQQLGEISLSLSLPRAKCRWQRTRIESPSAAKKPAKKHQRQQKSVKQEDEKVKSNFIVS